MDRHEQDQTYDRHWPKHRPECDSKQWWYPTFHQRFRQWIALGLPRQRSKSSLKLRISSYVDVVQDVDVHSIVTNVDVQGVAVHYIGTRIVDVRVKLGCYRANVQLKPFKLERLIC